MTQAKNIITTLLSEAGIAINGNQPWDIQVHNEHFYQRVMSQRSLGLGESYMEGWWDCQALDSFFARLLRADLPRKLKSNWRLSLQIVFNIIFNAQNRYRAPQVAKQHYNLDNHLYELMLGKTMAYTCAYWKDANNLDAAQKQKFDLVCKKLNLQPGDNVLELGCGWGGFAYHAAKYYGCKITAVNIASEHIKFAKKLCADLPITFYCCDYRDVDLYNPEKKQFDKIVSIGLCEHVGYKNYPTFMKIAHSALKDDGLFLLHTIGSNRSVVNVDRWTDKYIFPNGMLPSIKQLGQSMEPFFVMEDWHNFGAYYDKTLMAWHDNFNTHWPELSQRYDQRFYRMWCYYLLSCAGSFRSRRIQLWQLVLSKNGILGGYYRVT